MSTSSVDGVPPPAGVDLPDAIEVPAKTEIPQAQIYAEQIALQFPLVFGVFFLLVHAAATGDEDVDGDGAADGFSGLLQDPSGCWRDEANASAGGEWWPSFSSISNTHAPTRKIVWVLCALALYAQRCTVMWWATAGSASARVLRGYVVLEAALRMINAVQDSNNSGALLLVVGWWWWW